MTPDRPPATEPPPGGAPHVARLLDRLGRRLDGLILSHGLGTLLVAVSLWLAFAFVADWFLHVPQAVRWLHLGVLVAVPVVTLTVALVRPWRRRPDRSGLAVLIERQHPDLHELLVSAVQIAERGPGDDADPALVQSVLADAERRAQALAPEGVLEARGPRLRLAAGVICAGALALAAASEPGFAAIFLDRLLGGTSAWPQRTHLHVSIPVAAPEEGGSQGSRLQVEASPERIDVIVARGNDVPVLVRAEGRVPDEVALAFEGGSELFIASSGDGSFRTVLRSCQDDVAFHVTGGDDRDGLPQVSVTVLDPPDVAGLAIAIEPPTYSGLGPSVRFDRDVEVLAGSRLVVVARPDPPEARGRVRLLPEDRVLELAPMPYPAEGDGAEGGSGLGFELVAERSLRLRFELLDSSGLENPDPGLFAVHVVADRRPEVELLAPSRGEMDVVVGGALRVVARASDDFGIARLAWRLGRAGREETWGAPLDLDPRPVPARRRGESASSEVAVAGATRVDVASLPRLAGRGGDSAPAEGDSGPSEGDVYLVEAVAHDTRPASTDAGGTEQEDPDGVGRAGAVRVRVVSPEEYLRRLQDRLARLRAQAGEAELLQREKSQRVRELLAALESDQPEAGAGGAELTSALAGQRRVQGDVQALERELAAIVEGVLYARLDDQAEALFGSLDASLSEAASKGFDAAPWRELIAGAGTGGPSQGLARQLLAILEVALIAGEDEAVAASEELDRAAGALDLEQVHGHLLAASQAQERTLLRLGELIDRLAEWDNFQSVLNLARDILNRQKTVRDRTKEALDGR